MSDQPVRMVLDGVPRINFYQGGPGCPEDIILPSVMRSLMEYFHEDEFGCRTCRGLQAGCKINCSYSFFVGMTGAGSFLSWKEGWEGDNVALFYMHADPAATDRRAFQAAGYAWEYVEKSPGQDDESVFRQRIIESIQHGQPVVGYGVVGPPEPCIITGYDEGGKVLIGWSCFQDVPGFNDGIEFEPAPNPADGNFFRKRDWLKDTICLVVIGEKLERPPLAKLYRDALEWILTVSRNPRVRPEGDAPEWYRGRANGLAAYDAWAAHLLRDEDFPDDEAVLRQRYDVHNGAVGTVAEARWYGSQFLIQASSPDILHYALTEDLLHAAACYAAEHDLMWKVWDLAGGNGNPDAWRIFADPAVRRQIVPVILQAKQKDAEAVEYVARALAKGER